MNTSQSQDIVIRVDTMDQLFNTPDLNPFSDKEIYVLGESALLRVVRRLLGARGWRWESARLVIELPPDQITPDLQADTLAAIRRYCDAKSEDNRLSARLSRLRGLVGLIIVAFLSLIVLGVAFWLVSGPLSGQSQVVQALVVGSASVFAWVILWDPLEKLLFDWVPPTLENRVLSKIRQMDIVVRPEV